MGGEQNFAHEALWVGPLLRPIPWKILAIFSECHPCLKWWLPQPCPSRAGLFRRICPSPSSAAVLSKSEPEDSGLLSWEGTEMTSDFTSLLRSVLVLSLLYLSTGFISGGISVALRRPMVIPVQGWWVLHDLNLSGSQGKRGAQVVQCAVGPSQWIACHYLSGVSIPLPLKVTSLTCFFLKMSPPSGQV